MAESVHSAQPVELEVPVTIQGSKIVDGSDKRELFSESTKTTLVFVNGAVLNLKTRVAAGQCVFLRNEETGREILCRVIESPNEGQAGYTDLEFTVYQPEFWGIKGNEAPAPAPPATKAAALAPEPAPVAPPPPPQLEEIPAPAPEAPPPAAVAPREELVPAGEEIPLIPAVSEADKEDIVRAKQSEESEVEESHAAPAMEPIERNDAVIPPPPAQEAPADFAAETPAGASGANEDEAHSVAASSEAAPAETPEDLAAGESGESQTDDPLAEDKPSRKSAHSRPIRVPNFKARKIAAAVSVAAAITIISVQVYLWRARYHHPAASGKSSAAAAANHSAPTPATGPSAGSGTVLASNVKSGSPGERPGTVFAPKPKEKAGEIVAKPVFGPAPGVELTNHSVAPPPAPAAGVTAVSPRVTSSADRTTPIRTPSQKTGAARPGDLVPVKIVSQPQPGYPHWAKKLDLDPTVQLDAVIDEHGNVVATSPISGARLLQGEAERAVVLWIFQPATLDGKPTKSHITLTVVFQR